MKIIRAVLLTTIIILIKITSAQSTDTILQVIIEPKNKLNNQYVFLYSEICQKKYPIRDFIIEKEDTLLINCFLQIVDNEGPGDKLAMKLWKDDYPDTKIVMYGTIIDTYYVLNKETYVLSTYMHIKKFKSQ